MPRIAFFRALCAAVQGAAALICGLTLLCASAAHAAPQEIQPRNDAQVIETLAPRLSAAPQNPEAAALQARQWISQSRQSGDPRYLGRAQGVLARWWDRADAPPELAVLQATVQQSRHEFDAARKILTQALQRDASLAQGWLTLATLERVAGRYSAAQTACEKIDATQAALYRQACLLETASLLGQQDAARSAFTQAIAQSRDAATQSWLLSLLAESEERAGRDESALMHYRDSLQRGPDGYTALALADALLRTNKPAAALEALQSQNPTDAVLLRRAYAHKTLGDARWKVLQAELAERFAALDARGDDPALHARERAQAALWLEGNAARAWAAAQVNLGLQKEPLDWWLALQSATMAKQTFALGQLRQQLAATGLKDARLAAWLAP